MWEISPDRYWETGSHREILIQHRLPDSRRHADFQLPIRPPEDCLAIEEVDAPTETQQPYQANRIDSTSWLLKLG